MGIAASNKNTPKDDFRNHVLGMGPMVAVLVLLVVTLAWVLGGCSNGSDGSDGANAAQPATQGSIFIAGDFDDLPRYPGSDPAGGPSQGNDTTTQSFFVDGASPRAIIDFYTDQLTGWERVASQPEGTARRAEFSNGDQQLEVNADRLAQSGTPKVQYSLILSEQQ